MSNRALYRKYRSTSFAEVLGQDHIVEALQGALKRKQVSHAYLFTGPRGVGKTSVARLLAHEIISQNYKGDIPDHIDIIEIDAASNTGVDDVRELREKAFIGPAVADYKIYIIDEVHMLSKAAFNALLKILEEPPEHVVFIMATTEAHKLPATVISRTQRFGFKPVSTELATKHLKNIAKKENIALSDDAAMLIARHGNGSFRDSISLLDQLKSYGIEISADLVRNILGQLSAQILEEITVAMKNSDTTSVLDYLNSAQSSGSQASEVALQLVRLWHEQVVTGNPPFSLEETLETIEELLNIEKSPEPQVMLEVCLIKHTKPGQTIKPADPPQAKLTEAITTSPTETSNQLKSEPLPPNKKVDAIERAEPVDEFSESNWSSILNKLKKTNNSLYSVLRMSEVEASVEKLILKFSFPFHHRLMKQKRNQEIVVQAIERDFGIIPELVIELDESGKDKFKKQAAKPETNKANEVMSLLGGEVVSL